MITTAKICALLLSGAVVGSGATVAVHKVAPTAAKAAKAQGKPGRLAASRPRVARHEKAHVPASPPIRILDCPSIGSPWAAIETHSLPSASIGGGDAPRPLTTLWPVWSGGGAGPIAPPPSVSPSVPEPSAWALSIIGFGLVGASVRRGLKSSQQEF